MIHSNLFSINLHLTRFETFSGLFQNDSEWLGITLIRFDKEIFIPLYIILIDS